MIASSIAEDIFGTWLVLMLGLIVLLWIGIGAQRVTAFIDKVTGHHPSGVDPSRAQQDATIMRAKGEGPNIGN